MDCPILLPFPRRQQGNMAIAISSQDGLPNGNSNTFLRQTFVKMSSGNIIAVATGDITAFAFALGASISTAQAALGAPYYRFGDHHWPLQLAGLQFLINVTDNSGHVGEDDGAPQLSEVSIGAEYGIYRWTSGTYTAYQALNVDDTSTKLFRVIDKPLEPTDGIVQTADTYNPMVLVQVKDSCITSI